MSPEPKDAQSRMKALKLYGSREPVVPPQASHSASSFRNTTPDPSDTYMAPQFQESFKQVVKAAMNEINEPADEHWAVSSLPKIKNRSSSNSERATQAIVPAIPKRGETCLRSRVVDIKKNLAVRNFFLQVPAEHTRD